MIFLYGVGLGLCVGILSVFTVLDLWADFGSDLLEASRFVLAYCRDLFPRDSAMSAYEREQVEALAQRIEANREKQLAAIASDWREIQGRQR